jgi:hypothetical protein
MIDEWLVTCKVIKVIFLQERNFIKREKQILKVRNKKTSYNQSKESLT